MPDYKFFGKRRYENYGAWHSKAEAQRQATKIRNKGFKARVVAEVTPEYIRGDMPPKKTTLYVVYIGSH